MTLEAHYTIETDDGFFLYVRAHGLYRPGPGTEYGKQVDRDPRAAPPATAAQDDVEFASAYQTWTWKVRLAQWACLCW
jgi:hypothetical protein